MLTKFRNYYTEFDIPSMDFNDVKTYKLISSGNTDGVFQIESAVMKDVCRRLQPTTFEDIIAILSLVRPDTMGEIDDYIEIRHGRKPMTFLHEDLKPILGKTYGKIIYQEQLIAIVKQFGGFSGGEADLMRRAIGKKIPEEVQRYAEKFKIQGVQIGYAEDVIEKLYTMLIDKGGYLFNKSHATGYAIITYIQAYQKAHYPLVFMSATLNNQKKDTGQRDYDGISSYINVCKEMGISVELPNINISSEDFTSIKESNSILYGLGLIKGVGSEAVNLIIEERPFSDYKDFFTRCGLKIDKTSTIALIKSGAIDCLGDLSRSELLKMYFVYRFELKQEDVKPISSINKNHISELLAKGLIAPEDSTDKKKCIEVLNRYRKSIGFEKFQEKYMEGTEIDWEMETVNNFITSNPFDGIKLPNWEVIGNGELGWVGGTITSVKKTKVKKGKTKGATMAFLNISTSYGVIDCVVFADKWQKYQDELKFGKNVLICGEKKSLLNMSLSSVTTLEQYKVKLGGRNK